MIIKLNVKDRSWMTKKSDATDLVIIPKSTDNTVRLAKKHNIDGKDDIDNYWFGKTDFEEPAFNSYFESNQFGVINKQSEGDILIEPWDFKYDET